MNSFTPIRKQAGYTLTELMITVGIIGVLAAVAIPSYNGYVSTTKQATAQTNAESLAVFLDEYFYENGSFVAGTYAPGGDTTTLPDALGWRPEGDNDQFTYVVGPCAGGAITECYTISVTYLNNPDITASLTREPAP